MELQHGEEAETLVRFRHYEPPPYCKNGHIYEALLHEMIHTRVNTHIGSGLCSVPSNGDLDLADLKLFFTIYPIIKTSVCD